MSLNAVKEIWSEVKQYISSVDRNDAAESIVSILIDHDYDPDDIRSTFKGDSDIKRSLELYNNADEESYEEEEEDDDYSEDEDYDYED